MEEIGEPPDEWNYQLVEENVINEFFSNNNKRSIAQRRAEKCGFHASGISTPAMLPPPAMETFLTIPSGLTPTALLDSPVMLPNSQAPQSPTTGSFQQLPIMINQENSMSTPHVVIKANCPIKTNNVIDPLSFPSSSNTQSQSTSRYPFEFPAESHKVTNTTKVGNCSLRGEMNSNIITSNGSDDGYTWRKYGQKTVKGSEFPRSYYKCTQQNCLVKKKVERSPDGHITEIIYKGEHNHHKSQPLRRATMCSNSYDLVEMSKENGVCKNMQFKGSLKRTPILTKNSDLLILNQKTDVNVFDIAETTPEPSSTLASCDDEDRATEGSTSLGDDVDDNEFEYKRRRREFYPGEINLSSRTTREPRVVVQIESDVDVLDDSYRWRKYGQKVVKENPNPRSYYKCTSAGCQVRKHVERAPDNLKSVMTTYEGKHNHEVPSMNKTNGVATVENQVSDSILNGKSSTLAFSKIHKISNLGTQVQDFNFQFERKPFECFFENQISDLRCGVPLPLYDMRFLPNLQSPLPYNSHLFTLQMPNFSLPLNFPTGTNIVPPLDEFHFNDLPLTSNGASSESSLAIGDQNKNNNDKKLRPLKANEEIRNENLYDYQNGTSVLFGKFSILEES